MNDNINSTAYDVLDDPLSSVTRSTKRSLYIFTTLCILITYTGVVLDEANILGFKFPGLTEGVINWGLFCLGSFSFTSFVAHAWSDYFRHRHKRDLYDKMISREMYKASHSSGEEVIVQEHLEDDYWSETGYRKYQMPIRLTKCLSNFKLFLDFIFPLLFGSGGLFYFAVLRLL